MIELLLLAFIVAAIWCAWPTCAGRARWWLLATMIPFPLLAWLYWVPRGVRYRLKRRRQLYQIEVPIPGEVLIYSDRSIPYPPDRLAHRRQRRQDARQSRRDARHPQFQPTTLAQHRASVRFWQECQRTGTPTEQVIAPQVLTFLAESTPPAITPDVIESR